MADLIDVGNAISISRPVEIIDEVLDSINKWPEFAKGAGVNPEQRKRGAYASCGEGWGQAFWAGIRISSFAFLATALRTLLLRPS